MEHAKKLQHSRHGNNERRKNDRWQQEGDFIRPFKSDVVKTRKKVERRQGKHEY